MDDDKTQYPDKMLRGISTPAFYRDSVVMEEAFHLDPVREDGYHEISITWYDNQEAFDTIMNQKRNNTNEIQFVVGVAELDRLELKMHMKVHFLAQRLAYERRPTKSNKYHGNLLVKTGLDKQMNRIIKSGLATLACNIVYPNPNIPKKE